MDQLLDTLGIMRMEIPPAADGHVPSFFKRGNDAVLPPAF